MTPSQASPPSSARESIKSELSMAVQDAGTDTVDFGDEETRERLERKLVRKIDIRMSIQMLMYGIVFIDRANIAAVRLRGFEHDLHLHGQQYATILATFSIGLVLMQVPGNMLLNYTGRSIVLTGVMIIWGVLALLVGFTENFVGALVLRIATGFVESVFFPGVLLLFSKWYKRNELGLRIGILSTSLMIFSAFGSLIAAAILDGMDGVLGHAGWRWVFFLEGAAMLLVAITGVVVLPDFPEMPTTTHWLSAAERRLALQRMAEDAGCDGRETDPRACRGGLGLALRDWRVWLVTVAYTAGSVSVSYGYYMPTLIAGMGFSPTTSLLLCAPPPIFAALVALPVCRHSDKTGERFYHICIPLMCSCVGFIVTIVTTNSAARYSAVFLMMLCSPALMVFQSWVSNSFLHPSSKRAAVLAVVNCLSQVGSIAGSYTLPTGWGPTYRKSFGIYLATMSVMMLLCYVFKLHLAHLNRKLDKEEEESGAREKGFRYLL